ncbi:MAG: hydrogenase maturation nickel metallochaperone HypA [Calditrichaeota bacterium]|nr:MAG: hydrogenase maturation nickel metallochaperone HypA [Calditrichota bacterium]
MHELSIAQSIFETVLTEKRKKNLSTIEKIGLKIGSLSSILPDSLEFSFNAIKIDTELADTVLEMEIIPIQGNCKDCKQKFQVHDYAFFCPHCQSGQIEIQQGMEMEIAYLEIED